MNVNELTNQNWTNYALVKQIYKLHNCSVTTNCGEIVLRDSEVEKLKLFLTSLLEQRKKGEN